jgi:hypothetical protein
LAKPPAIAVHGRNITMLNEKQKLLIPNTTQVPNLILDLVIPRISEGEARCLLYICRRTFGFRKEEDCISFSQFERGIKSSQGRILDFGTGLSRPAINMALRNLLAAGAIFVLHRPRGNRYRLNLHMDVDKVVNEVNRLRKLTTRGRENTPKVVNKVYTQNLELKEELSIPLPVDNSVDNRTIKIGITDSRFSEVAVNQNQVSSRHIKTIYEKQTPITQDS